MAADPELRDEADFEEFWHRQESVASSEELVRHHALRVEFRRLAERNWTKINEIGAANRRAWRKVIVVLVVLAVVEAGEGVLVLGAVREPGRRVAALQQQRRQATKITCAVLSAVTDAGRAEIRIGSLAQESPFTRFLEAHGFPSLKARQARAEQQARGYARSISTAVEHAAGRQHARAVLTPDGSIDCNAFERLVAPPG